MNDVPLALWLGRQPVTRILHLVHDPLSLSLGSWSNLNGEWLAHGDDIWVYFIPWQRTAALLWLDVERPGNGTKQCCQFHLCEIDTRAGSAAISEGTIAREVREFSEWLLVCRPRRLDPSLWDELVALGVLVGFAADKTMALLVFVIMHNLLQLTSDWREA